MRGDDHSHGQSLGILSYLFVSLISSLLHIYCAHLSFLLVAVQPGLWSALLIKMKIDPKDFITKHLNDILPRITAYTPENQVVNFCFSCVSFGGYLGMGEFSGGVKY